MSFSRYRDSENEPEFSLELPTKNQKCDLVGMKSDFRAARNRKNIPTKMQNHDLVGINLVLHHYRPLFICSEHFAAIGIEAVQGFWGRVAVEVVGADGDDGGVG